MSLWYTKDRQVFIFKLYQLAMCKQGSGLRRNSSYLIPPVFNFQLVSVTITYHGIIKLKTSTLLSVRAGTTGMASMAYFPSRI